MFGVVLWSDGTDRKAVIWCEDHGELAYYSACKNTCDARLTLEPGDLVQFEVAEVGHMRRVTNPRLVAEKQYPSLAEGLSEANDQPIVIPAETPEPARPIVSPVHTETATIVPFVARQRSASRLRSNGMLLRFV